EVLATRGPYRLTRNPLYLGSFLMGLGFCLMGARLWLVPVFLIAFYWIYRPTIRKEEEILQKRFGADFDRYKQSVPRFFPRWPTSRDCRRERVFDWRLVQQHREYQAWIGVTAIFLLMILKMNLA
ncbi:MAG: isoprenylcysteine carboxylmethyltransferase family protein, partial [Nitrospirae bacterium]|nr:isoprenylcysteine carboxylmethyltransferase family protein [Nitrospirota bacterium]